MAQKYIDQLTSTQKFLKHVSLLPKDKSEFLQKTIDSAIKEIRTSKDAEYVAREKATNITNQIKQLLTKVEVEVYEKHVVGETNTQLMAQNAALVIQNQALQVQIVQLQAVIAGLRQQIAQLQREINAKNARINGIINSNIRAANERRTIITALQNQIINLTTDRINEMKHWETSYKNVADLALQRHTRIETLQNDLAASRQANQQIIAEREHLRGLATVRQNVIDLNNQRFIQLNTDLKNERDNNQTLTANNQQLTTDNKALNDNLTNLQAQLQQITNDKKNVEDQLRQAQTDLDTYQAMHATNTQAINRLTSDNILLQQQLQAVNDQLAQNETKNQDTIANLNSENDKLKEEEKKLTQTIADNKNSIDNLQTQNQQLNITIDNLQAQNQQLADMEQTLREHTRNLANKIVLTNSENKNLQHENAILRETEAELQQTIGDLKGDYDKILNQNAKLHDQLNNFEFSQDVDAKRSSYDDSSDIDIQSMLEAKVNEEVNKLKVEYQGIIDDANHEISTLREELEEIIRKRQKELGDRDSDIKELRDNLLLAKQSIRNLQSELANVQQEMKNKQAEFDAQLKKIRSELGNLQSKKDREIAKINDKLKEKTKQYISLSNSSQAEIKELKDQITILNSNLSIINDHYENMTKEYKKQVEELKEKHDKEIAKLSEQAAVITQKIQQTPIGDDRKNDNTSDNNNNIDKILNTFTFINSILSSLNNSVINTSVIEQIINRYELSVRNISDILGEDDREILRNIRFNLSSIASARENAERKYNLLLEEKSNLSAKYHEIESKYNDENARYLQLINQLQDEKAELQGRLENKTSELTAKIDEYNNLQQQLDQKNAENEQLTSNLGKCNTIKNNQSSYIERWGKLAQLSSEELVKLRNGDSDVLEKLDTKIQEKFKALIDIKINTNITEILSNLSQTINEIKEITVWADKKERGDSVMYDMDNTISELTRLINDTNISQDVKSKLIIEKNNLETRKAKFELLFKKNIQDSKLLDEYERSIKDINDAVRGIHATGLSYQANYASKIQDLKSRESAVSQKLNDIANLASSLTSILTEIDAKLNSVGNAQPINIPKFNLSGDTKSSIDQLDNYYTQIKSTFDQIKGKINVITSPSSPRNRQNNKIELAYSIINKLSELDIPETKEPTLLHKTKIIVNILSDILKNTKNEDVVKFMEQIFQSVTSIMKTEIEKKQEEIPVFLMNIYMRYSHINEILYKYDLKTEDDIDKWLLAVKKLQVLSKESDHKEFLNHFADAEAILRAKEQNLLDSKTIDEKTVKIKKEIDTMLQSIDEILNNGSNGSNDSNSNISALTNSDGTVSPFDDDTVFGGSEQPNINNLFNLLLYGVIAIIILLVIMLINYLIKELYFTQFRKSESDYYRYSYQNQDHYDRRIRG